MTAPSHVLLNAFWSRCRKTQPRLQQFRYSSTMLMMAEAMLAAAAAGLLLLVAPPTAPATAFSPVVISLEMARVIVMSAK